MILVDLERLHTFYALLKKKFGEVKTVDGISPDESGNVQLNVDSKLAKAGGTVSGNLVVTGELTALASSAKETQTSTVENIGSQIPSAISDNHAKFALMNTYVNADTQDKDWVLMKGSAGPATAIGVGKTSTKAFIMRGSADNRSWADQAELITTSNILNQTVAKANYVDWASIANKPTTYIATAHTHTINDITNASTVSKTGLYSDLLNIPTSVPAANGWTVTNTNELNFNPNGTRTNTIYINYRGSDGSTNNNIVDYKFYNGSGTSTLSNVFAKTFIGNLTGTASNVDWNNVSNKPNMFTPVPHTQSISTITDAAKVAMTGSYADLVGTPSIPYTTSQLINNSGFITAASNISGNAATATKATYDKNNRDIVDTYSTKADTVTSVTIDNDSVIVTKNGATTTTKVNNTAHAILSDKATADASGNVITSTYATKADAALLAPLASPTFTGTPSAPTATNSSSSTQIATTAFVQNIKNTVIDGATLNTLNKLSAAINNDASFASTMTNNLALKVNIADVTTTAEANKILKLDGSGFLPTSITGSAVQASKDGAGQRIDTTYIKGLSVNGQNITYTKGDGTVSTIVTQDTKVSMSKTTAAGVLPVLISSSVSDSISGAYFSSGVTIDTNSSKLSAVSYSVSNKADIVFDDTTKSICFNFA